jgi:DNA-binding HxlR family transcriptional regulator
MTTPGEHIHAVAGEEPGPYCPIFHAAAELIGRRWTAAIVRVLLAGHTRFSDVQALVPGLSDRLLSQRLRELEDAGIVERLVIPDHPVRIEYHLTDCGRDLQAIIDAVSEWAHRWGDVVAGELQETAS